jgi:probable rRNA maturation factor
MPDLDLAFEVDPDLSADLLELAGCLAEPYDGSERWHQLFSLWLADLADELPERLRAQAYCVGLGLVDDGAIADLNSDWREKDGPTDVLAFAAQDETEDGLAFPMPSGPANADGEDEDRDEEDDEDSWEEPGLELGDIVISLETAARQAGEHGNDLPRELLFLASHGLLHLLGWDHPDETQLAAMLERQDRLIHAAQLAGLA